MRNFRTSTRMERGVVMIDLEDGNFAVKIHKTIIFMHEGSHDLDIEVKQFTKLFVSFADRHPQVDIKSCRDAYENGKRMLKLIYKE